MKREDPVIRISAPGMDFLLRPWDADDFELMQAACDDAQRRVMRECQYYLPAAKGGNGDA